VSPGPTLKAHCFSKNFSIATALVGMLAGCGSFTANESGEDWLVAIPTAVAAPEPTRERPLSRISGWATWNALRGAPYELDDVERHIEDGKGKVVCQPETMVSYAGSTVRYAGAVKINPAFRERLERFEEVVAQTAIEVYGRAPHRIRHYGA